MRAILWLAFLVQGRADIYSCGGFVKSSVPIDYSKIQVKLLTPDGHLKHEEECNPQNGYYMIPIYNKGQYSLKVSAPEGWYFEPETVDFKLDGVSDPCTKNLDINFVLTGFSIHGVVDGGSGTGPAGLSLTLKQNRKVIDTATTTEGGKYSFKAVAGTYEVSTGADSSVCISHGKATVEQMKMKILLSDSKGKAPCLCCPKVKNASVLVKPDLRIAGYQFAASVLNGNRPLPRVKISLYSESKPEQLANCEALKTPVDGMKNAKWGDGVYFTPAVQKVEVKDCATKVSFSVAGFTAKGRVVVGKEGIAGADVLVGGKKVAKTDSDGYYTLSDLKEGPIEVIAQAPHTSFSVEKCNLKLPHIKLEDVKVEGFEVCGSVEKSPSEEVASSLILKRVDNSDTLTIRPGIDGKFCKMVAPAKYTISPADASSTLTIGLRFGLRLDYGFATS